MPAKPPESWRDVYLLPLDDEGAPAVPGRYISLPPPSDPPYVVRFVIEGTSAICRQGSLWVNIPQAGATYATDRFHEFKLKPDFSKNLDISVPILAAGAYAFYTTHTILPDLAADCVESPRIVRSQTYYIDVSPRLTLQDVALPLDALSVCSVLSKCMGTYPDDWEPHLQSIGQRGYNMIHFAPLMRRGASNSPYSIYDQLRFDPECFPRGETDVVHLLRRMEHQHGLLGMTDVVWNHTANNSPWLEEHPEAGYNVDTAPWLQAALELEDALLRFSQELGSLGLPTHLTSLEDLDKIMHALPTHVLEPLRLWDYYTVDVARSARAATDAWVAGQVTFPYEDGATVDVTALREWPLKQKADFLRGDGLTGLGRRHGRTVDARVGAALLTAIFGQYQADVAESTDEAAARHALVSVLNEVNAPLYAEYDGDRAAILDQLFNRIKYLRLDDNGPRLGPIDDVNPLIESYFTRLPLNDTTRRHDPRCLALVNARFGPTCTSAPSSSPAPRSWTTCSSRGSASAR